MIVKGDNMANEKSEMKLSEEKIKIIDNAEFVKIVKKAGPDDIYIPIRKNGKEAFLIVQKQK